MEMLKLMQQQIQAQAEQHQASMALLTTAMEKNVVSTESGTSGPNLSQLMNEIGGRISKFTFDLEEGKTFSKWYARYGTAFTVEGDTLKDENRVSLLVSKLADVVYEQYSKRICPKEWEGRVI